ncbi:hypothetical protein SAMN05660461_3611 [Chitinophaga ginsengisegetis]|uniref:Uncharacterized protein n=1 Tax=Chitinophaga ginsengisegetis TaxID=393003 RepID=A0A1T5P2I1_9BACT|nr:hypothetical protein SAMN05660461_3611 [Chitinophaga ginsengisegetis]
MPLTLFNYFRDGDDKSLLTSLNFPEIIQKTKINQFSRENINTRIKISPMH